MIRPELRDAREIEPKTRVPASQRTPERDEVAAWVEEQFVDGDEAFGAWTFSDMADEVGFSRTHVTKVLELYFDPVTDSDDDAGPLSDALDDIEQTGDGYRAGLRDGFREGVRFALQNAELLQTDELLEETQDER